MNVPERDNDLTRFEEELRTWGGRPPRIPAAVARRRVVAALPVSDGPVRWWRLAAAAALLVILALAAWRGAPRPRSETMSAALTTPPLDPNVVVWVLDSRTTVYFVLSPDGSAKGGVS